MLHRLEITGFDRSVQVVDLATLLRSFAPLEVELGVVMQHSTIHLHPPKQRNSFRPRNPDWDQILEAEASGLRLACHASGSRILERLLRGHLPDLRHPAGLRPFRSLQLNTTSRAHPFQSQVGPSHKTYTSYVRFVEDLLAHGELRIEEALSQLERPIEVIVQVIVSPDAKPVVPLPLQQLARRCQSAGVITRLLLDTSGGRGQSALERWPSRAALGPELDDVPIGYAGGLQPGNISEALARLPALLRPGEKVWLGMESGVRAGSPSRFDLKAVEAILQACRPL
jgi:phosphoribosylanthranilate isomerase